MKNIKYAFAKFVSFIKYLEKYKILTYIGLIYLSISMYNLREENLKLKIEVEKLTMVNKDLIFDMVLYNRTFENFPRPVWNKVKRGNKFIAQYFNPKYVSDYGHHFDYDRYKYIGRTDFYIYGEAIARRYYENDIAVAITGKPLVIQESYKDASGNLKKIEVIKWRDIIDRDTIIYGMTIRDLK